MKNENFREQIERISKSASSGLENVTKKEILHYEILALLQKEDLLQTLTFAGGTSLRLCYGNQRLSEDLDFDIYKDYHPEKLKSFAEKTQQRFTELGIDVYVKPPKILRYGDGIRNNFDHIRIDRWYITFSLTPEQSNIPHQKIKLEIATVPAYTRENRLLKSNYPSIISEPNIIIPTESLTEIMADKLISLPASEKYIRYRDIWDLAWMANDKGIEPDIELINLKITDYRIENYKEVLERRIASLPGLIENGKLSRALDQYMGKDERVKNLEGVAEKKIMATVNDLLSQVKASQKLRTTIDIPQTPQKENASLISLDISKLENAREVGKAVANAIGGDLDKLPAVEKLLQASGWTIRKEEKELLSKMQKPHKLLVADALIKGIRPTATRLTSRHKENIQDKEK